MTASGPSDAAPTDLADAARTGAVHELAVSEDTRPTPEAAEHVPDSEH